MRAEKRGRIAAALLGGCLLAGLCRQNMTASGAVFDESSAVAYGQYASSHVIEDSVLFIGTYLIHTQSLTDELYEKAMDSASDSNQTRVYYKSELAGGAWFDITDAGGLMDISGQGRFVEQEELADLWVTCYTGLDGITRNALDGQAMSIFDTPDPYDLYNLPELEPVRFVYDNMFSADSTGVNLYYYERLLEFFQLDLRNEVTDLCGRQLAGLQMGYESLQDSDKKELAELVSSLMSRIDARRRAEVFWRLSETEENELDKLQNLCLGLGYESKDYGGDSFAENGNVSDALGTSLQNCRESFIEYSGKMPEEGETVLKKAEYAKTMEIADLSQEGWSQAAESLLLELEDLYHIQDDVTADKERELRLLEGELLETGEREYLRLLSQGAGGAYQAAKANGVSQAAKNQVLDDQKSAVNGVKSEFQYLIQAKTKRQAAKEAVDYVYGRIEQAEKFYDLVKDDDFRVKARETIDDHILWLQSLARSLSDEDDELQSEIGKLEERKEELLVSQADALDDNDLSAARKYEAMIAQVDEELEIKEQELNAVLADASGTASQKAQAVNQAGNSTVLNNINQIKNDVLSAIADGGGEDSGSLETGLSALAALGAESALAQIRDKLADSGNSQALKAADRAIEDSRSSSLHSVYGNGGPAAGENGTDGSGIGQGTGGEGNESAGTGEEEAGNEAEGTRTGSAGTGAGEAGNGAEGTGTGSAGIGDASAESESETSGMETGAAEGAGTGTKAETEAGEAAAAGLGETEIRDIIENVLGAPFEDLSPSGKVIATAAASRLGRLGNRRAADLARIFLNQCIEESNPYIYRKLKGESEEYIPLRIVGICSSCRYVYDDDQKEVTLTRKSRVYRFAAYRDEMTQQGGAKQRLAASVKVQQVPYLSGQDALEYFQCQAEYIDGTDYGAALSGTMENQAEKLLRTMEEGG